MGRKLPLALAAGMGGKLPFEYLRPVTGYTELGAWTMGLPELLGTSVGMLLANPFVWIAGIVVSRTSVASVRFWIEFLIAVAICTALQIGIAKWEDLPTYPLGYWLMAFGLAMTWAAIIFRLLRKLRLALFNRNRGEAVD